MIESAAGIILRTRPLTETSLIVQWLTPQFGRIATVAKGARRPKSPFLGKLDLFYEGDFTFSRSRRSELHTLREIKLRETHKALREDIHLVRQAAYCAALIDQTTETETPLPGVYELMRGLLGYLTKRPPRPSTVLAFELKLLAELGQQPDLSRTSLTPGSRQILKKLLVEDWPALSRLKPSAAQALEIQQCLNGFLIFHLGKLPGGRAAALRNEE